MKTYLLSQIAYPLDESKWVSKPNEINIKLSDSGITPIFEYENGLLMAENYYKKYPSQKLDGTLDFLDVQVANVKYEYNATLVEQMTTIKKIVEYGYTEVANVNAIEFGYSIEKDIEYEDLKFIRGHKINAIKEMMITTTFNSINGLGFIIEDDLFFYFDFYFRNYPKNGGTFDFMGGINDCNLSFQASGISLTQKITDRVGNFNTFSSVYPTDSDIGAFLNLTAPNGELIKQNLIDILNL